MSTVLAWWEDEPLAQQVPAVATAAAVAGAVSRLMSAPVVERLLPSWLRKEKRDDDR